MTITTAIATRQGTTETNNADCTACFTSEDGLTAAALVDVAGHAPTAPKVAMLLAETAARVGAQRGGRAGLLSAALLVADAGAGEDPEPSGVAVVATRREDERAMISWIGDSHAYGWDGTRLHRYTTPHTLAEQMRTLGIPVGPVADDWLVTSLAQATPANVLSVTCEDPLIILTSDGLDTLGQEGIYGLIRENGDDPQALADALVAAVDADEDGYRDDATVIVLAC
jgi:serine/threonine protein phosphatase PrpC